MSNSHSPTSDTLSKFVRTTLTPFVIYVYVPHGSQIMDTDILSTVFSILNCTDVKCSGKLNLYQYPFRDGLQSYLLLKCSYCHLVIAEFPTSLPVRMKPNECVNEPRMLYRKKSQVNIRAC